MAYQTQRLVMLGLGVEQHAPNHGEPRLDDGIHLRWQPDPAAGIPWHGYHLYRRAHKSTRPRCLAPLLKGRPLGPVGAPALATTIGTLSSDAELVLTDQFAVAGVPEVDLDGRTWTDLTLLVPPYLAYRVDVTIGLCSVKPIAVTAYFGGQPLETRLVQGSSNDTATVSLRLDAIDRIRCSGGPRWTRQNRPVVDGSNPASHSRTRRRTAAGVSHASRPVASCASCAGRT